MPAQELLDFTNDFSAGQDDFLSPNKVAKNAYAKGVNVSTRGGNLRSRHGISEIDLNFADDSIVTKYGYTRSIQDLFRAGKFQAIVPYYSNDADYVVFVISGYLFRMNVATCEVILLSKTIKVNELSRRINWSLADKYLVFFDSPDYPVIVEGDQVFRADPDNTPSFNNRQPQVPISTVGTLVQGRLFVANDGREWTGGDPIGNVVTPQAPITFTEVLEPAQNFTGDAYSLGTSSAGEPITAMGFLQSLDSTTGIGPLFIATENSMFYFAVDQPRSTWATIRFGNILLFNAGVENPRAVANVNSDLVFISGEGNAHALSTAQADAQRWGNVPISREVENYLNINIKGTSFVGYFNNRIYFSANPFRTTARTSHNQPVTDIAYGGLVVLDLANISTFGNATNPIWDGLYTASYFRPMDMVTIKNSRAFVIAKNSGSANVLYELKPEQTFDVVAGKERFIKSILYTREYEYDQPNTYKKEKSLRMTLNKFQGKGSILVERRAGHSEQFRKFGEFKHTAPFKQCGEVMKPKGLDKHNFKELVFSSESDIDDADNCDPVTEDMYNYYMTTQLRLTIQSRDWEIRQLILTSTVSENVMNNNVCDGFNSIAIQSQCRPDFQFNEVETCSL